MDKKLMDKKGSLFRLQMETDPGRRKKALDTVREAAEKKKVLYRPALWEVILAQFSYVSKGYWAGQGLFLSVLLLLFRNMDANISDVREYIVFGSMGAALLGMLAAAELGKHGSCRMAEIEQTCYLNLKQIWLVKMALFGVVDIGILGLIVYLAAEKTEYAIGAVVLYILVPFVISNICYFFLLFSDGSRGGKYVQAAAAAVLILAASVPGQFPKAYAEAFLWIWGVVLAVSLLVFAVELYKLTEKLSGGKAVCWN